MAPRVLPLLCVALLALATFPDAAFAEEGTNAEMDQIFVEAMVLDSAPFHECQNRYSAMHGLFTRMEGAIQERLTSVQRDFDEQAGEMLEHDDRMHEKLSRAEFVMGELIEEMRGSTLGAGIANVYRLPYLLLAVAIIGLGVQYAFLGATVSKAKKGLYSLPGAGANPWV